MFLLTTPLYLKLKFFLFPPLYPFQAVYYSCIYIIIYNIYFKNPSFSVKYFKKQKALQLNAKGLGIVRLPLVDSFRTFSWGKITNKMFFYLILMANKK